MAPERALLMATAVKVRVRMALVAAVTERPVKALVVAVRASVVAVRASAAAATAVAVPREVKRPHCQSGATVP